VKLSSRVLASAAVVGALACVPAAAQAGTVSVEETPAEATFAAATNSVVHFAAGPGEDNVVTITRAEPEPDTEPPPPTTVVIVRDAGAPLTPGAGCSAIDANTAACTMHSWHSQEYEYCGHDCYNQIPGTAWRDGERIELGDGNDLFASSIEAAEPERTWPIEVDGGSGNDQVATGSGDDTVTPGPGDDVVEPGEGDNQVIADAQRDGDDTLAFLTGAENVVDDSARTAPLHLADHVLGVAGEADTISGPAQVIGGSADDELISAGEVLEGRAGDDTLIGSPGDDEIDGGPGNDTIRGKGGEDRVYDPWGDDVVDGGGGDDYIRVGAGADLVAGGPGDDRLLGESGGDTLKGGAGDDFISGDEGRDTIRGDAGRDQLVSGFENAGGGRSGHRADTGVDSVDCGPGKDASVVNVWDKSVNCEERRIAREVEVIEVRAHPVQGSATIFFSAPSTEPAKIAIGGEGVKPGSYVSPHDPAGLKGAFLVRAQGTALKRLRRTGRVKLVVNFSWQLSERPAVSETRPVGLALEQAKKGSGRR
jgi:Ca2+-binding RTX toxin-like protein